MEEKRLTFGEHLEELRMRIIRSLIAIIICFILCWIFKSYIMKVIIRPHRIAMSKLGYSGQLQQIEYAEGFYGLMKACFIAALFLSSPYVMCQIWAFIAAGLYPHEKRYVYMIAPFSFGAFLIGVVFGYFMLIPFGLEFLVKVPGEFVKPGITIGRYISLFFMLTLLLGLVFELPLVMLFFSKIDIFSADAYASKRRYAIVGAFIIAAILTPPDPFTQVMVAIPSIALYEIGIILCDPTRARLIRTGLAMLGVIVIVGGVYIYVKSKGTEVGNIVQMDGSWEYRPPREKIFNTADDGVKIKGGGAVKTDGDGMIEMSLDKDTRIKINPNTTVEFGPTKLIYLKKGEVWVWKEHTKRPVVIRTPDCRVTVSDIEANVHVTDVETIVTILALKKEKADKDEETFFKTKKAAIVTAYGLDFRIPEGNQKSFGKRIDAHKEIKGAEAVAQEE